MMNILWSILVCSIPNRLELYMPKLMRDLCQQASAYPEVEVLMLFDNQKRSIGSKRNALVQLAKGYYISFIDDDDHVAPNYVELIRNKVSTMAVDVCGITMQSQEWLPDGRGKYQEPAITRYDFNTKTGEVPQHTSVWRRELALREPFKALNAGEDAEWSTRMRPHVRVATRIEEILYYWDWRAWIDQAAAPNLEDVVHG